MKQAINTLVIICLPFFLIAQGNIKEFEGVINYQHQVVAKEPSYNVEYDYSAIGKYSEYYYKNGNYRFVNHNSYIEGDLFKAQEVRNYLLMAKSDTVLYLDAKKPDIEVIEFKVEKSVKTILNYSCDLITVKVKPTNQETPISYRRYYFTSKLPIDPAHFKQCKGNAYELIFGQAKSLPLRIEFEWPQKKVIWQATKVEKKKLNKDIFKVNKRWVLKEIK